jgi:hypothetical protein
MLKLKPASYDWAITHLLKESDTDLFPRPFELDAIKSYAEEVVKTILTTDIGSYSWSVGRSTIVPKGELSFRPATQLDPWDSLTLTALIKEFGDLIEEKRIPYHEEVVFSHRFEPMLDGTMYKMDADWPSFWEKSKEKAARIGGYVAITDVSSFYNQIYHHRLENQLASSKIPQEAVKSIIELFKDLTQGVSRGIPVGPHVTHLLAECVFDPIDRNLLDAGYEFCRFVDDIHIFCKTRQQAQLAFYDLAEILDKEQKMSLQSHKSRILSAEEFIEYAGHVIAEAPLSPLERNIIEVIDRYTSGDRYRNIDFAILSEEDLMILSQQNLETLFSSYLDHSEPNFTRIRWLFRRLAQVGVPGAVSIAVAKLEQFSPAIADLASYLLAARYNFSGDWRQVGEDILHALELPIIQHSEYLTVILLDLFARLPILNHRERILQKYRTSSSPMVKRKIVCAATAHNANYWLRQRKEELPLADPWLKRALMAGASTFSKDERKFWLQRIERGGTELEKFIARWANSWK